ncbi:hypothetical protein GCM10022226_70020 [Sphaerisporangium flaviroseum]|uniref:Tat pathway signal sequence domain protein n=1 Tax=Sphaerisporangium flaviroseum TaxID=509199 RepID=A0ABP7J9K3_9ACTN
MNDTFEDRLLAELKAEMAVRAPQGRAPAPRRTRVRRLLGVTAVAGTAAAAAIAVPLVTGTGTPAYAVTRNPDGTVTLTIHELRDPEGVEKDLAAEGVRADVTYMPLGKRCERPGFRPLEADQASIPTAEELGSEDPAVRAKVREKLAGSPSGKAIRMRNGITIYPQYVRRGQTVVIEVAENQKEPTVDEPGVAWSFSGRLTDGPVNPCRLVDDPGAFDIGDATPPPGS